MIHKEEKKKKCWYHGDWRSANREWVGVRRREEGEET